MRHAIGVLILCFIFLFGSVVADDTASMKKDIEDLKTQIEMLQYQQEEKEEQKFKIFGFMGVSFNKFSFENETALQKEWLTENSYFAASDLNLYFLFEPVEKYRGFMEVKLSYYPAGRPATTEPTLFGYDPIVVGGVPVGYRKYYLRYLPINTTVIDDINWKSYNWGSLHIERAYIERSASDSLSIKAGQYLTPFGIWNLDHGQPALINTKIPFMFHYIPTTLTGIEFSGKFLFSHSTLQYYAGIANGETFAHMVNMDSNESKALNGRLNWKFQGRAFKEFSIGASGYTSKEVRYGEEYKQLLLTGDSTPSNQKTYLPELTSNRDKQIEYTKTVYGADLKIVKGNLTLMGEIMFINFNDQKLYKSPEETIVKRINDETEETWSFKREFYAMYPNSKLYYGLLAYDIPFSQSLTVTPFVRYETGEAYFRTSKQYPSYYHDYDPITGAGIGKRYAGSLDKQELTAYEYGIKIRHNANVSYKFAYAMTRCENEDLNINSLLIYTALAF